MKSIIGKLRSWFRFEKGDLRHIGRIAGPAFAEFVLSGLFVMVDMVMLGQLPGPADEAAIAAVGLTNNPTMLTLAVFAAINVGVTTAVAWAVGAGDQGEARAVVRHGLTLAAGVGVCVAGLAVALAGPLSVFMGGDAVTAPLAERYFRIVSYGLPFAALSLCATAALRGAGFTRVPMFYNIFANLLNVLGNYILIFGKWGAPRLEVEGAAISTSASRVVGFLLAMAALFLQKTPVRLRLREKFSFQTETVRKILRIGLPSMGEQFVLQIGFILYARTVSGLGQEVFAAHQIGLNINNLSFNPTLAMGVAATTLSGQQLGAERPDRAKVLADACLRVGLMMSVVTGLLFLFFSHPIAGIYGASASVLGLAGLVLKIQALGQPGMAVQMSLAGALRGAGDTKYPLYASIAGVWVFRVVVAHFFVRVFNWGLTGAWATIVLDQYSRALVVWLRYRSGRWMREARWRGRPARAGREETT